MTLDELVQEGKTLSDDDLNLVISAMQKELTARRDKEQQECWNAVCRAIDTYVARYGYIDVMMNGRDELTLYKGDYAFGGVGEISICE